ncbi:MAG TPA: hypothetical protein PKH39_05930 [Woeseiaceae bacterium]|nr:hypothetical protein [Woeseiaceae bacterium]
MTGEGMIMVINRTITDAENLKELIEFMDEPEVCTSTPAEWRSQVGQSRLDAVFVGPDLSETEIRSVVGDVGKLDPNIPIVMLHGLDR